MCGSGKKFKACCGAKTTTKTGEPIGFAIGKDISLPYQSGSTHSVIVEERGRELQYAHIRSGHMRWQWKNDAEGNRIRKLIFIYPTVIRPDLPLKPELTPRKIQKDPDTKKRNPNLKELFSAEDPDFSRIRKLIAKIRRELAGADDADVL